MSVDFSVKTFIPEPLKILDDAAIEDAYVRTIYAMNRAEPGSRNYYALKAQVSRWQTLEATARAERYGLYTGDGRAIQEWFIPKAPQPAWL